MDWLCPQHLRLNTLPPDQEPDNSDKFNIPHTLKLLQHNVRHWATQKHNICNIYRTIDPDIILINSHGNTNDQQIKIFNYTVHQSNKHQQPNDGVAIAVKRGLQYKLINNFRDEIMALEIATTMGEIVIGTAYLPPRRNYLPMADFQKLLNRQQPVYILGDLNARHTGLGHTSTNQVGRDLMLYIRTGKALHLGPHFPTFIGSRSRTTPDIVLSNNKAFLNYYLQEGPLTSSDHLLVICTISTSPIQHEITPRLNTRAADWEGYCKSLEQYPPPTLQNATLEEIDEEVEKLQTAITTAARRFIPMTRYKTVPHMQLTDYMRHLQARFTAVWGCIHNNIYAPYIYHNLREIQEAIRMEGIKQHQAIWDQIIAGLDEEPDPQTFWKKINRMLGSTRKTTQFKDQNGVALNTPQEIEEAFRRQWSRVFRISDDENELFDQEHEENIRQQMEVDIWRTTPYHTADMTRLAEHNVTPITVSELDHWLRHTKEKAPGFTGTTKSMLANLPANCKQAAVTIVNAVLSAGYFLDCFKEAKMIFIPKANTDVNQVINHRPISLLECLGKLYEKTINDRVNLHRTRNGLHNLRQHAFVTNRGTHTALAIISELIAVKKAEKCQVNLVLRDVKKAFDKVWHLGLQYKILQMNLPPPLERVLCDFLADRTARIQIENYTGPPIQLESGVPQGAVLSPTLYSIYIADIPDPAPYSEFLCFADDITQVVAYQGKSEEIMARHTARAIETINQYESKWKIQTNTTKFKIIPMAKFKLQPVIVDDNAIPYSHEGKVLGLPITTNGYKKAFTQKKNAGGANLLKIKRFRGLNPPNKRKLYNALVKSSLTYPPVPMNGASETNQRMLQVIQSKALRFIYNVRYTDRISNEMLHLGADMEPVNMFLHNQASKIWRKTDLTLSDTMKEWILEGTEAEHHWFRRSRSKALGQPPRPLF